MRSQVIFISIIAAFLIVIYVFLVYKKRKRKLLEKEKEKEKKDKEAETAKEGGDKDDKEITEEKMTEAPLLDKSSNSEI